MGHSIPTPDGATATVRTEQTAAAMPDDIQEDSYFPRWDQYCTKRQVAPPADIQPLLPTPVSPALPVPELALDDDNSPVSATPQLTPTCSCPPRDDCVVECLALLLGSAALLSATLQYQDGVLDGPECTTAKKPSKPVSPRAISKLERTLTRLLLPFVSSGKGMDLAAILYEHRRNQTGALGDGDLCRRLRARLDSIGIDLVDTFAPLQHDLHLLLALMGYDEPRLQSKIWRMRSGDASAKTKLLLEANAQLIVFSVKDIQFSLEDIQQGLRTKIDELAMKVDLHEMGLMFGISKT